MTPIAFCCVALLLEPALAQDGGADGSDRLALLAREGDPAFTDEQAQAWVVELLPMVERAAGRAFEKPPVVKLVSREEGARAWAREVEPFLRRQVPELSEERFREALAKRAAASIQTLLGYFSSVDKIVYLLPGNVEPVLRASDAEKKLADSMVKLVIAHELTHALQDQEIDLGKTRLAMNDGERELAFRAVIEGHAVFVQDSVGMALDLDAAAIELSRLVSAGVIKVKDPALQRAVKSAEMHQEQVYLGGRDFIEYHEAKGGAAKLWDILASPPARTSMISRPETYVAGKGEPQLDLAAVLRDLEKEFDSGLEPERWFVRSWEEGDFGLRSAYAVAGEAKVDEITSRVARVQTMICSAPLKSVDVTLFVLMDDRYAARLVGELEAIARAEIESLKASSTMSISDVVCSAVDEVKAKAKVARQTSYTRKVTGYDLTSSCCVVRVGRGAALVELVATNDSGEASFVPPIDLRPSALAAIAVKVLDRYEAALAKWKKGGR